MLKVCTSQFNYLYGNQIHFPYSIACLVSYFKNNSKNSSKVEFEKTFVFRDEFDAYVEQASKADILLCSCYVWNWQITNRLSKKVKEINPECIVIFGGPQVPDRVGAFFDSNPHVDVLVHGEGEVVVKNLIDAITTNSAYSEIRGISTSQGTNLREDRISDLSCLDSPYLTDTVWDLVEKREGIRWISSWETNRGCPYKCTFCDWGSATYTKLRQFPIERLKEEVRWFSENQIVYIDCCDSNFGILPRDIELAKELSKLSKETKYPEVFRQSWAKNSSEKIIPIAKVLQESGLLTAVGLAVETLDEITLKTIERKNIKFDTFSDLTKTFRKSGLPTYTELIRGLPGETKESFDEGLGLLVENSEIDAIYIYNCTVLPNAKLNEPNYRREHDIETVRSPIFLAHSSLSDDDIQEYEQIVVSTKTAPTQDLKHMHESSWLVLVFHSLGVLEYVAHYFNRKFGLELLEFYKSIFEFADTRSSIFSEEISRVRKNINKGFSGKGWGEYDQGLGDIWWPIEEASWLRLTSDAKSLEKEICSYAKFICKKHDFELNSQQLEDLACFQVFLLSSWTGKESTSAKEFSYAWKEFFISKHGLSSSNVKYTKRNKVMQNDRLEWNKHVIWYGRRRGAFKTRPIELELE